MNNAGLLVIITDMKITKLISAAILALMFSAAANAQDPKTNLRPNETVLLYTDVLENTPDPVFAKKITSAGFEMGEDNKVTAPETISKGGDLSDISKMARIDLYFPKKPNGQMVVVCPGGGYRYAASFREGLHVAEWMLERGITVAVLKYRIPNGHCKVPLTDVHNTFRYCRQHAEEWGVNQIGIIGFSAGGHLAATGSTLWVDEVTRPDFSILVYPVITMEIGVTHKGTRERLITENAVWNHHLADWYSLEKQVTRFTPPTFLALCSDDKVVPAENSLIYYNALIDHDVPAELHIWPNGGHGWGFASEKYNGKGNDRFSEYRAEFEVSLERWLQKVKK